MFEQWLHFAPTLSPELGLSADTILRAHEVVRCIMGDQWIDGQERARVNKARSVADTHPLDLDLRSRTRESVLEVLQLACYLCAFDGDPKLGDLIVSLRDADKYEPTIAELDIAWKFRNAGAAVRLAAATPSGEADFAATIGSTEYPVEVTTFPADPMRGPVASFHSAVAQALERAHAKARIAEPVALEIEVLEVTGSIRPAVHAAVTELVAAFSSGRGTETVGRRYAFGTLRLRPAAPGELPYGGDFWTRVCRTGVAAMARSGVLGDTEYKIQRGGNLVYLREESDDPDPFVRLRRKLKTKAAQLRGCVNGVIVVEAEPLGPDVFNCRQRLEEIVDDFARNHSSATAIAVIHRPKKADGTRGISGHFFSLGDGAVSTTFWQTICGNDRETSVLEELRMLGSS